MIVSFTFLLLLIIACGLAFTRGGRSERGLALVMLVGSVLTPIVTHPGERGWHGIEPGVLAIDLAALGAIVLIMVRSNRFWPIWTTGFQLLTVAAHLGPEFRIRMLALPYALEEQIWSWVILMQLGIVSWARSATSTRKHEMP